MEKKLKAVASIPGTLPSYHNAQLLVSSGISSVDEILGGGLPVGTVTLLEEDVQGIYADVMFKYFVAEGVVNKHSIYVASQDVNPKTTVRHLPALLASDPEPDLPLPHNDAKMKIAFRYEYLPTREMPVSHRLGHYYDLSRTMLMETINQCDVSYWDGHCTQQNDNKIFTNPAYYDLLEGIRKKLQTGKFLLGDSPVNRTILRIALGGLGSPMWFTEQYSVSNQIKDMNLFFVSLRALMRSAFAVALVTVPSHLYDMHALDRCIHCSDIAIRLQAFAGTELSRNPYLAEYHGYFHLDKLAAINSFVSQHPGSIEYTFKLRRKKFYIEVLHLPPDIETSGNSKKKSEIPTMGCGSSGKHLLEF